MSTNRASSTSSGVRNLRAMFENSGNESSSSPSRGRSPTNSEGIGSNGTKSPRPGSNVRASFVAVERSGQVGVQLTPQKSGGSNSIAEKRRPSFSLNADQDPEALAEITRTISDERDARRMSTIIRETVPEVAVETPTVEPKEKDVMNFRGTTSAAASPGVILPTEKVPSQNPDKVVTSIEEPEAKLRPADPTAEAVVSGDAALPASVTKRIEDPKKAAETGFKDIATERSPRSTVRGETRQATGPASIGKLNGKPQAPKSPTRSPQAAKKANDRAAPAPINTSKSTEVIQKRSPNKPATTAPKTPVTPTAASSTSKAATPRTTPARNATKPSTTAARLPKKTSRASLAPAASTATGASGTGASDAGASKARQASPVPTSTTTAKKAPRPSVSAFHKPPPRSPTRPVRLPASATAPTAASAAKTSTTTEGGSNLSRSPSRASTANKSAVSSRPPVSASRATAPTASSLHKKPSRASMPAQHMGVPKSSADRPRSRVSAVGSATGSRAGADGGFLSRMMRPTASSASKTHEKVSVDESSQPGSRKVSRTSAQGETKRKGRDRISGESIQSTSTTRPDEVSVEGAEEVATAPSTTEPLLSETTAPVESRVMPEVEIPKADNVSSFENSTSAFANEPAGDEFEATRSEEVKGIATPADAPASISAPETSVEDSKGQQKVDEE